MKKVCMIFGLLFFSSFPTSANQLPAEVPHWSQGISNPLKLICDSGVTKVTTYHSMQDNEPNWGSASTISVNNVVRLYYYYSVRLDTGYTFEVKDGGSFEAIPHDAWHESLKPYGSNYAGVFLIK